MAKNLVDGDSVKIYETGNNIYLEILETESNSNGDYIKYEDGTLICRGFAGPLTTPSGNGTQETVSFPYPFIDTNYQVNIEIIDGQAYWGGINTNIASRSTTAFTLATWNNSNGNNSSQYFTYIAIGRWK